MTNDEPAARAERQVFALFAQLAHLHLKAGTIVQVAPTVECNLMNGQKASFELMTLDSEEPSKRIHSFHTTHSRATPVAWSRIRDKPDPGLTPAGSQFELIAYSFRDTLRRQSTGNAEIPHADIIDWLRGPRFVAYGSSNGTVNVCAAG